MAVFFFAAVAGFFFTAAVIRIQEHLHNLFSGRSWFLWLRVGWTAAQLIAGVVLVYLLITYVLLTSDTDTVYRLSKTRTLYAFFGFVFGAVVWFQARTFLGPAAAPPERDREQDKGPAEKPEQGAAKGGTTANGDGRSWWLSHTAWPALLLLFLLFFGLLAPHPGTRTLFDRITRLTTPLGEVEFAALKASQKLDLDEARIKLSPKIELVNRWKKRMGFDQAYARYVGHASQSQIAGYEATGHFIEVVIDPIVNCVSQVQKELSEAGGSGSLREELRPFVRELRKVVFVAAPGKDSNGSTDTAEGSDAAIHDRLSTAVERAGVTLAEHLHDEGDCKIDAAAVKAELGDKVGDLRGLKETPYIYMILAHFLFLINEMDTAIDLLEGHASDFKSSLQFNSTTGYFLYADERESLKFLPYYDAALQVAENEYLALQGQIALCPQSMADRYENSEDEKCGILPTLSDHRYYAILLFKNSIVYQTALTMASERASDEIEHWTGRAIRYARELREIIEEGDFDEFGSRLVELLEAEDSQKTILEHKAKILDTVAVFQMVHAATAGGEDRDAMQDARETLQRALDYAQTDATSDAITTHLEQADALLGLR